MMQAKDIERLFRQHYAKMVGLGTYLLADAEEAKDVVSDVFAHLMDHRVLLAPDTEEAYLMRSVRNRCLNKIAHKGVKERVGKLLLDDSDMVLAEDADHRLERVMQIIDGLEPPIRKQILTARYLDEKTYQEVANEMGMSKVTVYNHIAQALNTIRQLMRKAEAATKRGKQ